MRHAATHVLHVPGNRGIQRRNYPRTATRGLFLGTFEPYTASLIHAWQEMAHDCQRTLRRWLKFLDLTDNIEASPINDVEIEIKVGRLAGGTSSRSKDLVSIADVGVGVSQVLPGLVALLAAQSTDLVYIEEPELHLHPNPQVKLAHVLAEASMRGPSIVVETHSALLLREIQTLVATGELDPANVSLNWCSRHPRTGATTVAQADLTNDGTYGEWPIDFDDVALDSERRFLDAVSLRRR